MTITIARGIEVTRPTTTPIPSSVIDHATVVTNPAFGLTNNVGLWVSYNCLEMATPTPMCPDPLMANDGSEAKSFQFAPWIPGYEFAVYGGVQCSLVGLDEADQKREVERVFRLNEGKAIEQALLANRFVANTAAAGTVGNAPTEWDAPVELGEIPGVVAAIGAMEGYAATIYAGVPTLHMPRAAISLAFAAGALVERGGKYFTKAGSKVAAGGGYDADGVPSGEVDMYVTGEVYVERAGEIDIHQYPTGPGFITRQAALPGYDEGDDENLFTDNTMLVLAEQAYRVAVDCFVAKVTVALWSVN